jgi:hypothetical protein
MHASKQPAVASLDGARSSNLKAGPVGVLVFLTRKLSLQRLSTATLTQAVAIGCSSAGMEPRSQHHNVFTDCVHVGLSHRSLR